jgi:hypothetical protein
VAVAAQVAHIVCACLQLTCVRVRAAAAIRAAVLPVLPFLAFTVATGRRCANPLRNCGRIAVFACRAVVTIQAAVRVVLPGLTSPLPADRIKTLLLVIAVVITYAINVLAGLPSSGPAVNGAGPGILRCLAVGVAALGSHALAVGSVRARVAVIASGAPCINAAV